jgi:alginate O-acetyltransferase complex protein AlgI
MLFNSYIYILIFLPLTLYGYYHLKINSRYTLSIVWLILASITFYCWWNPAYLLLIIGSILCNYALGTLISNNTIATSNRRWLLIAGIASNLLLLFYYKYLLFFVGLINFLATQDWELENILLPLAISFFTFQQIAFLVDSYRQDSKHHGFLNYCLFVMFFPQLIAGPIVHHKEMIPQFVSDHDNGLDWNNISVGCAIFTIGLFKKVIIADSLAEMSTPLFTAVEQDAELSLLESWIAALAFTLQLYFDFSGYADMAVGSARMFNIKLPINFNSPYKSVSIIDFWRRWHMTLSRFLRDYLYISLGGNRKGEARRFANLFITMLLGGIWHGAGLTFVIWGALHAVYLIINHAWRKMVRRWSMGSSAIYEHACKWLTLVCIIVGWVFFRAETTGGAMSILKGMAGMHGIALPQKYFIRWGEYGNWLQEYGIQFYNMKNFSSLSDIWLLLFLLGTTMTLPNSYQLLNKYKPILGDVGPSSWSLSLTRLSGLLFGLALLYCLLSMNRVSEFLYFQF